MPASALYRNIAVGLACGLLGCVSRVSADAPVADTRDFRVEVVAAAPGNAKKITHIIDGESFWGTRKTLQTPAALHAQAELIVVGRPRESLTEREQRQLYFGNEPYPHLGISVAQVEILKILKKPAGFAVPASGALPISEPVFFYPHPEVGPDGLVLQRKPGNYRELKKGTTYLLFLSAKPKDDLTKDMGPLYGFVAPSLGKYDLDGTDPQDDEELERAYRERERLPAAERKRWRPPVTRKQQWKRDLLKRYADGLP